MLQLCLAPGPEAGQICKDPPGCGVTKGFVCVPVLALRREARPRRGTRAEEQSGCQGEGSAGVFTHLPPSGAGGGWGMLRERCCCSRNCWWLLLGNTIPVHRLPQVLPPAAEALLSFIGSRLSLGSSLSRTFSCSISSACCLRDPPGREQLSPTAFLHKGGRAWGELPPGHPTAACRRGACSWHPACSKGKDPGSSTPRGGDG